MKGFKWWWPVVLIPTLPIILIVAIGMLIGTAIGMMLTDFMDWWETK